MAELKKITKKRCKECKYHAYLTATTVCCYYIVDTGKRRGNPMGMCDKYEKGKPKRRDK